MEAWHVLRYKPSNALARLGKVCGGTTFGLSNPSNVNLIQAVVPLRHWPQYLDRTCWERFT